MAGTPTRDRQEGRVKSIFRAGDLTIHRIVEMEIGIRPAGEFFPGLDPEILAANRHWLQPAALDENDQIILCFQSYIVRTPEHVILVDSCIGNDKERAGRAAWHKKSDRAWMGALAAAGLGVADIDFVLCTHLHVDHVGWNTRLADGRWVPTFPNARYVFSARELDFWLDQNRISPIPHIEDSVLPILEAGRADLVASDHALSDQVRLMPTPGHTIDHFAVQFGRGRDVAVVTGDLIHSPLQALHPEIVMRLDTDPALATSTRRQFLERYCETETLCCFSHFPSPSVGHVKRWDNGFRCEYVAD